MRKLATIRKISDITPIENADAIEVAHIDGWKVVVKKDSYKVGDNTIYFEIDSWIPHELAPFLSKGKEPREYEGVLGERLKTVRLRGQISQGLLISMSEISEYLTKIHGNPVYHNGGHVIYGDTEPFRFFEIGTDLTEHLGVKKWEAPIPAQLAGVAAGLFPTNICPKSDQERIQNCFEDIDQNDTYEETMKLDGTSCTVLLYQGKLRVCSRNLELIISPETAQNTLVQTAHEIFDKLDDEIKATNIAFQMEVMGEGIQKNQEKIKGQTYFIYDVIDLDNHEKLLPAARRDICKKYNLNHVPVLNENASAPVSVDDGLLKAEGPSINTSVQREGIVYKSNTKIGSSFKCISNKWLLKNDG